ncbi:hypothetical protein QS306_00950 [Paraburkholderia bonniea]|uniref:hypothetical protein n=1 Tax=Paraburkholderia bonniea TaxID=2152891 RepID=UPI00129105E4|nr:hypothetical protein [Paraburkholderia bonniea]WJF90289.1 hypothetical protein QS306_00950 [Paraburkholderia bonniea]WJF93604.1 hypothetical protein QS308_00950 [Paraburkholderia bonniea]
MTQLERKRNVYRRAAIAYAAVAALPLFILCVSLFKGAGWHPMLIGWPAYLTFLAAVTYQFIKELKALKRDETGAD